MIRNLPDHPMHWDDGDEPAAAPASPPDPWTALRRHTPARISLGRAGTSLPTTEVLRFAAAHAGARDAVHLPLDVPALLSDLRALGLDVATVASRATSRQEYLTRPDLGRQLAPESRDALEPTRVDGEDDASLQPPGGGESSDYAQDDSSGGQPPMGRHPAHSRRIHPGQGASPQNAGLCIVIGDGLSAVAAQMHAVPLVAALRAQGLDIARVVVATQARVALGDEIGERVGASLVLVLLGERPGLSSPDSLGAYLTWAPEVGRADSQRNCVSNIRPQGLPLADAAARIAWLVRESQRRRVSGIALKDDSEVPAVGADGAPALPAT